MHGKHRGGLSIPKPIHLFETETLFPELEVREGQVSLPYYIFIMERLDREWRQVPDISTRDYVLTGRRRRHGDLNSKHLGFARKSYYSELERAYGLGIVVRDSALFWNVVYSPKRKKVALLDFSRWREGDEKELKKFKLKIDQRYRVF